MEAFFCFWHLFKPKIFGEVSFCWWNCWAGKSVGDQLSMVASKFHWRWVGAFFCLVVLAGFQLSKQKSYTPPRRWSEICLQIRIYLPLLMVPDQEQSFPPELQAWAIQWKDSQRWHGWNLSCRQMVGFPPPRLSLKVCVHAILRRHLVPPAVLNEVVWGGKFLWWLVGWKGMNILQENALIFFPSWTSSNNLGWSEEQCTATLQGEERMIDLPIYSP